MATRSSNLCLWVPKSGTQPSMHARTHVPTQGWGGTVHLSFRPASRFTLHSPTSLSLVTKRQTSGSQSVFILWLPSWQMQRGRGILTSGPECPQQSLPLEAKAEEPQAGRRGAPPNCHDPRVPTCGVEAKGDSTLEAGAQRSLGPLDKTCHFTASFLKKYSLDPVFELISVNVLSAVFFFFLAYSEPGILRVIYNSFVYQNNCFNFLNPK